MNISLSQQKNKMITGTFTTIYNRFLTFLVDHYDFQNTTISCIETNQKFDPHFYRQKVDECIVLLMGLEEHGLITKQTASYRYHGIYKLNFETEKFNVECQLDTFGNSESFILLTSSEYSILSHLS